MNMGNTSSNGKNLIEKHPLLLFFVFAYLFFFMSLLIIGIIINIVQIPDVVMQICVAIASWTPNIAAILIVWKIRGKSGISELFAGWKKWRVSIVWYVVGIIPIIIAFTATGINSLINGKAIQIRTEISWITLLSMFIFHFMQGATGEELGWRGYALPKLEERYSVLISGIILGLLISGWHSILHLVSPIGVPEWQFWLIMVCYCIIIAWVYNQSNHSLVIVTLFHFSFNLGLDLVVTKLELINLSELFPIYIGIYLLIAIVVIIASGRKFIGLRIKQ